MDRLEEAESRITGKRINDVSSSLAYHNLKYGIASLLSLGVDAHFECSPDFGITKNSSRFRDGFAMGGLLSWSNEDVAIPSVRPNCCGMIVVGMKEYPDFIDTAVELCKEWDVASGNHFISIGESDLYPFIAVFHGISADKSILYPDKSHEMKILSGSEAKEYYKVYLEQEELTKQERLKYVKALFPGGEIISNTVHQGLLSSSSVVFGCYVSDGETLYPFTTSSSSDSYLLKAPKGTILPHGSGYDFPRYKEVKRCFEVKGKRLFEIETISGSTEIVEYPNTLSYREGNRVRSLMNNVDFHTTIRPLTSIKF